MLPGMATKFDDLLAEVMHLPARDRARLLSVLKELEFSVANIVHDPTESDPRASMTVITVALPEDLALLAEDAGLLSESSLQDLIRRALDEYNLRTYGVLPGQKRRLVHKNGYLVVESLPGEKPITFEQVKKILDDMEW